MASGPLYCDTGPHAGRTRADVSFTLYLSEAEAARYGGPGDLAIALDPYRDTARFLLCDGCYQATTGLPARCAPGCARPPHLGLCLTRTARRCCGWCGAPGRLHDVPGDQVRHLLTVQAEDHDGTWRLEFPGRRQGPFATDGDARAAWHDSRPGSRP